MNEDNERVGSVADEAAKLLGALQDWAKENGTESDSAAGGAASGFRSINEHIATEGKDCKHCPVCQLISVARRTSPEVKQHLTAATTSLLQAAAAAVRSTTASAPCATDASTTFEKIDLEDYPD